jgi:hypothetical protein
MPIVDLVDDLPGNTDQLVKDLNEAVTARSAPASDKPADTPAPDTVPATAAVPDKLKGKSATELAAMYQNLESVYGRMANDLGQQRKLTDRLLDLKRSDDLTANGGKKPEAPVVDRSRLLEDPTAELTRFVDARDSARESESTARLANLEAQLAQKTFVDKHSDYADVANDPAFIAWVQASPLRTRLAGLAYNGSWDVADELLTEFKARTPATATATAEVVDTKQQAADAGVAAARRAGLESGASGGESTARSGKTYRRTDLLALRNRDPDAYYDEGFQTEILRAYAEGRVK